MTTHLNMYEYYIIDIHVLYCQDNLGDKKCCLVL